MRQDDGIDSFEANGESSKIHDNVTASRAIPTYMYYMMSFGKRAIFIWLILIALGELIFKVPSTFLYYHSVTILIVSRYIVAYWC